MTSWRLMKLLAGRPNTPFSQRRNYLVIPNVSWGFLNYEADMLVVTKSRYCTEIEVKISMADWKKDFEKRKHKRGLRDDRIKYQYYAAPTKLAERHTELELPECLVYIAPRTWLLACPQDFGWIKGSNGNGLVCYHQNRTFLFKIDRTTEEQVIENAKKFPYPEGIKFDLDVAKKSLRAI
jgi:hypothetical protein